MRRIAATVITIAGMALILGSGIASGSTQEVRRYTDNGLDSSAVSIRASSHRVLSAELTITERQGTHCEGVPSGTLTGAWTIKSIKVTTGRFHAVEEQDGFGRIIGFRIMFRGAIKEGVIRGAASLRYRYLNTKPTGERFRPCWSGRSSSDPLIHFVARVR